MRATGESFNHIGVHVGTDWRAECSTYLDRTPILVIGSGQTEINVVLDRAEAGESAVEFARALLRQVQAFAAEVDRLHTPQPVPESGDLITLADAFKDWSRCHRF
jgi:hypothetical protein